MTDTKVRRARRFMFTHYPEEEIKEIHPASNSDKIRYMIWQNELCPKTGRLHVQGYVQFTNPMCLKGMKDIFGNTCHFDKCRGNESQCIAYCSKEESKLSGPWEYGIKAGSTQGKRNDLVDFVNRCLDKPTDLELLEEHPAEWAKYEKVPGRVINALIEDECRYKEREMHIFLLWGKTGSGKTHHALEYSSDYFKLELYNGGIWFDRYKGQETLIIDEFDGQLSINLMKKILDKWPLQLPVKGASTWAAWKTVIIISNTEPRYWWNGCYKEQDYLAMCRRINTCYYCKDQENWIDHNPIDFYIDTEEQEQ